MEKLFNFLIVPMLNLLMLIYAILPGNDFGVAVIIVTILIRLVLWPVNSKQLHSQKKLRELQPEIRKIKQKSKGDRQKEQAMLAQLYKDQEVNPAGSCLMAIVQLPFMASLYFVFQRSSKEFGEIFGSLYGLLQNNQFILDLKNNPALYDPSLLGFIHLTKPSIALAVLAGLGQFIQTRMLQTNQASTKSESKKKQPSPQEDMMRGMTYAFPLFTIFIGSRLPAALSLYWLVSTIVSIIQQYLVLNKEVRKMEGEGNE
ncbi:membrane protein insertase YidC [Candidatus Saccharibacteria bacterium]|nr:membrane protein insertase YidC [Candidatus Saccharibacteria bacterium]